MASRVFRHSRQQHRARRTQQNRRPRDPQGTPHERAIRRLAMELKAREGLMGLFHAGVTWRAFSCLVSLSAAVVVETEKSLKIGSNRFVPDVVARCLRTHRILLVVEVWHTHTVCAKKKAAFRAAGLPWVEVRSWHVISRTRRQPLPVLDWAGPGLPQPPEQRSLFNSEGERTLSGGHESAVGELAEVSNSARTGTRSAQSKRSASCEVCHLRVEAAHGSV